MSQAPDPTASRLVALNDISHRVAASLIGTDDLHEAIELLLEGVGSILGVHGALLARFRSEGKRVFRTHGYGQCGALDVGPGATGLDCNPLATFISRLQAGEALIVEDAQQPFDGESGRILFPQAARALLVVPLFVDGQLESFFAFFDARPRRWEAEERATVELTVRHFARGIERLRFERALEESAERERRANRTKSEFLAKMSHELRTPMNAIVGYADLLGQPAITSAQREDWIAKLRRSSQILLSLVDDVLDLSKIEAGEMVLEQRPASPAALVNDVASVLRVRAESKGLDLLVREKTLLPRSFLTDPVRCKQILINLVGNAIRYTEAGSVTIEQSWQPPEPDSQGPGRWKVAVCDTGVGISAADLGRLFDPFAQVHDPRLAVGGTGLGLGIARELARALGGEITVASTPGVGSTFTLELPGQESASQVGAPEVGAPKPGAANSDPGEFAVDTSKLQGRRVLIIDDDEANREILRFLLERHGVQCTEAEDGRVGSEKALELARTSEGPELILMDMNMPIMDGFEATRALREAGCNLPILALTALVFAEDHERTRAAGCTDTLTKPVDPQVLIRALIRHLPDKDPATLELPADAKPAAGRLQSNSPLAEDPRFAEILERYVNSFPELVDTIRSAWANGEREQVRTHAHRLRGTASNYGFPSISKAAGACETAIRSEAADREVVLCVEELLELLRRAAA